MDDTRLGHEHSSAPQVSLSGPDTKVVNVRMRVSLHPSSYLKGYLVGEALLTRKGCASLMNPQTYPNHILDLGVLSQEEIRDLPDPLAPFFSCLQVWFPGLVHCLRFLPLFGVSKIPLLIPS